MVFRFSEDGPAFPNELLGQMLAGEVVFLCGAGVSNPQLPGFADLVSGVLDDIGMVMDEGEKDAFDNNRFEEVLGSLARRVVHPSKMYDAVERRLAVPADPDLTRHATLLRISRNLDNRVCVVTTNFDTLFERAVATVEGNVTAVAVSVAGQALPPPGAEDFGGVVHLHGRLRDASLALSNTPLVLTSAEYGDAYMRAGWASRFLFDLARCKSIVLIGYRVGDAPVRYFLNVLEADRERFADLRKVYTLEGVDEAGGDADARWSTVAVHPITFIRDVPGLPPYGVLWRDLELLADMLDRPRLKRRELARLILSNPLQTTTPHDLSRLDWLMRGKGDLWDLIISQVEDPAWFEHFSKQELWQKTDADWLLPQWFMTRWTNQTAIEAAIGWCGSDRLDLVVRADRLLHQHNKPGAPWYGAWNLLFSSNLHRLNLRRGDRYHFAMRMQVDEPTDLDLRRGIDLLTPHLALSSPWQYREPPQNTEEPAALRDFFSIRLATRGGGVGELLTALKAKTAHVRRLLQLANEAMQSSVYLARDAEMITADWDAVERGIPSVSPNAQNAYHEGVLHLVDLATHCYTEIASTDPTRARSAAEAWKSYPSVLGMRLWLYALCRPEIFGIDEVISEVLALPSPIFWERRPELFELIATRFAEASATQVQQLAERILAEGPGLYKDFEPSEGGTDWRPYARDHAVWTRLAALAAANTLDELSATTLDRLKEASTHLNRALEEQDFFGVYSSGVQEVVGDPAPLIDADPEARLELAHQLREQRAVVGNADWFAFCRTDSDGAFGALNQNGFQAADVELWKDLINSLAFPVPDNAKQLAQRSTILRRIFGALDGADNADIHSLVHALSSVVPLKDILPARTYARWWDRLWALVLETDATDDQPDHRGQFLDRVINTAPGKLAEALLREVEIERKAKGHVGRANMARLRRVAVEENFAGQLARGVFARAIGFLIYIDANFVKRHLLPKLSGNSAEAHRLRRVMIEWAQLGASASIVLKDFILQALSEVSADDGFTSQHAVAKLLNPVLVPLASPSGVNWGFSQSDVRHALRSGSAALRVLASQVLIVWQRDRSQRSAEEMWRQVLEPAFKGIWPQERRHKGAQITANLATLCVLTGDEFPNALETVKPYLSSDEGKIALGFLYDSDIGTRFPEASLDLLWCVLRNRTDAYGMYELAGTLDQIKAALPGLEIDRRFQWLETKATRLA